MKNPTIDTLYKRRSIRRFRPIEVKNEDIVEILKAGNMAPSATNKQPWKFIVIKNTETKNKLQEIVDNYLTKITKRIIFDDEKQGFLKYCRYFKFLSKAPVIISVICKPAVSDFKQTLTRYQDVEEKQEVKMVDSSIQSVSACIQNILISAEALGLGTCWMTGPLIAQKNLEKFLKINEDEHLIAFIALGYGKEEDKNREPVRDNVETKIEWIE